MASTYSDLKFELISTGEQSGTWGTTTNVNLGTAIEEAISGRATANFTSDANLTLTLTDTNTTQIARNFILNVTSSTSLTTTRSLIVPTIDKPYIIENNTTGGQSITVKTSAGTGVTIPNGKKCMVYANSTNVVQASDYFPALTSPSVAITGGSITGTSITTSSATITGGSISGITDLAIADGGTGASTAATARTNLLPAQAGNSGKSLMTNASDVYWGTPFVTGMIMMWAGTIATVPSGWALCNGANGTPDLRDRFIIGAAVDSAGVAYTTVTGANTQSGGSKDAIVVAHTHTGTTDTAGAHTHTYQRAISSTSQAEGNNYNPYVTSTTTATSSAGAHSHTVTTNSTGSSGTNANLPPYYALAFIMKL